MQLPLAHLDAVVIEEVPLELWRELFETVGWPQSLHDKKDSFSYEDVLQSFEKGESNDELIQALETLHELGSEGGREAIVAVMNERHVALDMLPAGISDREFALRLYLGNLSDASLADVFARAHTQIQESGERRRYHEFMGLEPRGIRGLDAKREAVHQATLEHCRLHELGEHVHVRAFEDGGVFVFQIIRTHHKKKPLAVVRGSQARATIEYWPVHSDIVRYEPVLGRLQVNARAASIVQFYRRAFGLALFDDETFFTGAAAYDLSVLQRNGREALVNHGVYGIGHVRMAECLWEYGDRQLLHFRGHDCFGYIDELKIPISEGTILLAKLKLQVDGKSTRPVTVTIRVPSTMELTQKKHGALIDKFLSAVGIRGPRGPTQDADLWSLRPWRHAPGVWRSLFRAETDALVRGGVLVPTHLESVEAHEQPGAGRVLAAHEVSPGEFHGVSSDPAIPSRSLSATHLDGMELNIEQLRLHLRERLAITGSSQASSRGDDLLDLGIVDVGGQRLRLAYALAQPSTGVGDRLRTLAGNAVPVLLVPAGHNGTSEVARVLLAEPLPTRVQVIRDAVAACHLQDVVDAVHQAPDHARVVVDAKKGKVWVDDVFIPGFVADAQPIRFVELLARESPKTVSKADVVKVLSQGRQDGDQVARHAKTAANNLIRKAFSSAGREFEDLFPAAPGGYRCACKGWSA